MTDALQALKVVIGALLALVMYRVAVEALTRSQVLVVGALFVAGCFLAIHGLFTGTEAAVAAGTTSVAGDESPD